MCVAHILFVQRACSYILLTKANLFQKTVQVDPICTICGQIEETIGHILWECPFAHNIQALVRGKIQKTNFLAMNFFLLMKPMIKRLSSKEFELWAMVIVKCTQQSSFLEYTVPSFLYFLYSFFFLFFTWGQCELQVARCWLPSVTQPHT